VNLTRLRNKSLTPWFKFTIHWPTRYVYLRCGSREWVWMW
jgi:hypothetical protein